MALEICMDSKRFFGYGGGGVLHFYSMFYVLFIDRCVCEMQNVCNVYIIYLFLG